MARPTLAADALKQIIAEKNVASTLLRTCVAGVCLALVCVARVADVGEPDVRHCLPMDARALD